MTTKHEAWHVRYEVCDVSAEGRNESAPFCKGLVTHAAQYLTGLECMQWKQVYSASLFK